MAYDLTNVTNADNLAQLGAAANSLSDGFLGILILITIFILVYIPSSKWGAKAAFATASLICSISAILLRVMNFIPDIYMYGSILCVAGAYIWMKLGG